MTCVFVFKQKTAYEMRISDWSSDVCSSDLNPDIPSGCDIVYLHGRGRTEREAGFALPLFGRANVRSYRGPLPQGPGFAWFENAGIGVALPSSLSGETSKVGDWIAADTGRQDRKSVVEGKSVSVRVEP